MKKLYIVCIVSFFIFISCTDINKNNINVGSESGKNNKVEIDTKEYQLGEIVLDNFERMQAIESPYMLTGKAPRNWFFEGVFPVTLLSVSGDVLIESYASGDWLTPIGGKEHLDADDMIEFTSTIEFDSSQDIFGETIIRLSKDNPRGDSNNEYVEERVILVDERNNQK